MHIKRAKQEIRDSIEAYLQKDADGRYLIPSIRQRPILLMGPPGIGKTQIMEQVARECGIGLVSYTITHHTRQSAIGLPFIRERSYGGKVYSVTEYTMSEIITSVYEKMEETGLKEGILFLDEINCVSETLAPTMLQFLQCKMFGNQKVPEGWIIVAAGNPPEYNKSVREFDIVTLDRLKRIDIEENYDVWREYAYEAQIDPAILAYLEIRKDHFYRVENTVDGKQFVTARGWEDLSELLRVYRMLGKKVDREVAHQYLQNWEIAKEFANYLELYEKYKKDYGLEKIVQGIYGEDVLEKLKFASFDERFSIVGMLNGKLAEYFRAYKEEDARTERLFAELKAYKEEHSLQVVIERLREKLASQKKAGILNVFQEKLENSVIAELESYEQQWKLTETAAKGAGWDEEFSFIKEAFSRQVEKRQEVTNKTMNALENTFRFLEDAFGESQEMAAFLAELNTNGDSIRFLRENDCPHFYKYNKGLLFDERQKEILTEMEKIEKGIEVL
nr:AAA family ATPase [uncultured Sellimonas sp.]